MLSNCSRVRALLILICSLAAGCATPTPNPQAAELALTLIASAQAPSATASATIAPQLEPSEIPTEPPTPTLQPDIYNMYIGKDLARQPEPVTEPVAEIFSIQDVEGYAGSYVQIFLNGMMVNGGPIQGEYETLFHFIQLMEEAQGGGFISQTVYSSYRSYEQQVFLSGEGQTSQYLQDPALFLAEPGRSEHQLGTAIDLAWGTQLLGFFGPNGHPESQPFIDWLYTHAHLHGFIVSYPYKSNADGTQSNWLEAWVTEYKAEPWHLRFVGLERASMIYNYRDEQGRNYLNPLSAIVPQQFYLP